MMRVVDLRDEVGDRKLELVQPRAIGFGARRQPQARPKKKQDVRCLADHEPARLEERRCERWTLDPPPFEKPQERRHPHAAMGGDSRDVEIVGGSLFQRKPHELSTALDLGPVVELVSHRPGGGGPPGVAA
jgi:hypothetical protein